MKASKKTEEKIAQLSVMEKNVEQLGMQKQQFQVQLVEVESALSEIGKTDKAYRIIGNIMVLTDKKELGEELESKKRMLEIRVKSIEKQEEKLREQAKSFQEEIIKELEDTKKSGNDGRD